MDSSRGRVVLGSPCKLSLTLSLFSDAAAADDDQGSHLDSNSNQTTAFDQTNNHTLDISRFMKRRRQLELGTEQEEDENEVDRVCSRNSDDGSNSNARKKLSLTKAQSALLEESFRHHPTLNLEQKQELARDLKLRPRQVEVWFQNRRARSKLKQTETNYEFLKKYCDKLTEENRWLHKELEIMRLPQQQQQQPVHTMATMCPCCRRIAISPKEVGHSRNSANASGIFSMPLKHPHSSN